MTSIIILTFNKLDYNKLCIESIRQYTEQDSYELIVVDNNSTDGTVEWLQCQQDIRLILNSENVGFPAGCNQGIKVAQGNSILLLNNDTIVTPHWLDNLKKCLFSSSDIGAVGAVTNSCSNFQSIPCDYLSIKDMIRFSRHVNTSNPEQWENRARLVGYCMLIKVEVISKIGLLDERFSPGNYEDNDYSLRIRNAGYRLVLCRDAFIHHFGSVSFGEKAAQFDRVLKTNKEKFKEKWGLYPHQLAEYELMQDLDVRRWFIYQHEFGYYKQLVENTKLKVLSLLDQAEFVLLSGDCEKAMLMVKAVADYAHHSHPGFFASPRVELILRKIANKLNDQVVIPPVELPKQDAKRRKVLHVLSQGYSSGGHTRTLERWMCIDDESTHSVVVTLNSTTNPPWVANAAVSSGGWYNTLDTGNLNLCQRAKMLRNMAAMWADLVVLHIHPHDPVAPVAFGVPGGPPVVFLNHADYAFTIGMSAVDLVAEHRAIGQLITSNRRNTIRSYILPTPLDSNQHLPDKQVARKGLSISADKIVFLANVTSYQVVSCGEYNFYNLLREIVKRNHNAEIIVIGPSDCGEWAQLKTESNGRIRTVGRCQDLSQFYSVADIYLDSIPLSAATEALEAGACGIPVVGLAANIATQLSNDIVPGIMKTHFSSMEELFAVIDRLITDAAYRISQGELLKAAILKNHVQGWTDHLSRLYSLTPGEHKPLEIVAAQEMPADTSDIVWAYFQHRSGLSRLSFG